MKYVDVHPRNLHWPACCCRCASKQFQVKPHTEKVVVSTTLGITRYRLISLDIPVCARCASAHLRWFGAAAVFAAIAMGLLYSKTISDPAINWILLPLVAALACVLAGMHKQPIKVVRIDPLEGFLRVGVYNDKVADSLRDCVADTRLGTVQAVAS